MGMFDSFYFKEGVLPDNKVDENHEFQTKSLDCSLDIYHVLGDCTVIKRDFWEEGEDAPEPDPKPINETLRVYSYEFLYENEDDILNRKYLGSRYQEYKITILNSKLVYAEKVCEEGYDEKS